MADLVVSASALNYVNVPPGSEDAVSTSFGYGYGGGKGQIGVFFNLLANNVSLDLPAGSGKAIDLISVKQDEDLPSGSPPFPDTPGDAKDHYTPTEGTAGYGTSQGPGTLIQDPKNNLFVGFELSVQHANETKTVNLNATVAGGGVKVYDGQVSDPAVDYELSYPDQMLNFSNGDVVGVDFLPLQLTGNPQASNLQAVSTLTPAVSEHLNPVYRFFDIKTQDHFYTISAVEKDFILKTQPTYNYEGAQ